MRANIVRRLCAHKTNRTGIVFRKSVHSFPRNESLFSRELISQHQQQNRWRSSSSKSLVKWNTLSGLRSTMDNDAAARTYSSSSISKSSSVGAAAAATVVILLLLDNAVDAREECVEFEDKRMHKEETLDHAESDEYDIESRKPQKYKSLSALYREVDELLEVLKEEKGFPGCVVAVSVNGETVYQRGIGWADVEQRVRCDPAKTVLRIASISKPMTTAVLALMHERGWIDLDASVQETYLKDYPHQVALIKQSNGKENESKKDKANDEEQGRKESVADDKKKETKKPETTEERYTFTARQLASHLSGVRHYKGKEFVNNKHFKKVSDTLKLFQDDPLESVPGTQFLYSTYNYNVLHAVIDSVLQERNHDQKDFLKFIHREVFDELGMSNTYTGFEHILIPHRARCYQRDKQGRLINSPAVSLTSKFAGGGFMSTVEDLIKFANGIMFDKILKPETKEMMWTPMKDVEGKSVKYGLGWSIREKDVLPNGETMRVVYHSGAAVGASSILLLLPDRKLSVAMICNLQDVSLLSAASEVAHLFAMHYSRHNSGQHEKQ